MLLDEVKEDLRGLVPWALLKHLLQAHASHCPRAGNIFRYHNSQFG